ncbi:hypothetical protein IC757_15400 [Wenzhouxiangella sp. AB-CW3]|uniref:hypothetical protein n=1 Tax=Wenzhouxiangella sp. AB-CW3 TaxID=2771012 RepID=UPI00168B1039|nr:hypothetical protein [Wenzhouxiangella sp. AB-CW3]QOC22376.1 hypothetical protein IC757_15400 [Wenzhouxiangella sp. AB-CW3]
MSDSEEAWHCRGPTRWVILGNPNTGQVFAFRVSWEQWPALTVEASPLDTVEQELYQSIISLRQDWEALLTGLTLDDIDLQCNSAHRRPLVSPSDQPATVQGAVDCPVDTALEAAIGLHANPGTTAQLEAAIREHVRDSLCDYQDQHPSVDRVRGIGLADAGNRGHLSWEPTDNIPRRLLIEGTSPNEIGGSDDGLIWAVELAGMIGDAAAVDIRFRPESSWVAGTTVSRLFSGNAAVDNPCVAQKFANIQGLLVDYYHGTGGDSPVDGFPMSPPTSNGGGQCYATLCARTGVDGESASCQFKVSVVRPCE